MYSGFFPQPTSCKGIGWAEDRGTRKEMEDRFPILFNYIDSRNKLHLDWLNWCGFKIINEKTFNDVLFYGFIKQNFKEEKKILDV